MAQFRTCPACGASVKLENVERHVAKAHPRETVDFGLTKEEVEVVRDDRGDRRPLGRRERWIYPVAAIALVAVLVVAVIVLGPGAPPAQGYCAPASAPAGAPGSVSPLQVGSPGGSSALFVLPDSEGETVDLAQFEGSVVLLDFMDPHCPHCQEETMDVLVPLHSAYGDRAVFLSVAVGFVGPQESPQDVRAFKADCGASWTYLLDDGSAVTEYGVTGTPTTFILSRGLTVSAGPFRGATRYAALAAALDGALGE